MASCASAPSWLSRAKRRAKAPVRRLCGGGKREGVGIRCSKTGSRPASWAESAWASEPACRWADSVFHITLTIPPWASGGRDNPSAWSRLNLRFSLPPLARRIVSCRRSKRFALSVAHLRHPPRLGADETQGTWAGTLSGDRERLRAAVGQDAFATRPAEGEASLFPVSANPWKP